MNTSETVVVGVVNHMGGNSFIEQSRIDCLPNGAILFAQIQAPAREELMQEAAAIDALNQVAKLCSPIAIAVQSVTLAKAVIGASRRKIDLAKATVVHLRAALEASEMVREQLRFDIMATAFSREARDRQARADRAEVEFWRTRFPNSLHGRFGEGTLEEHIAGLREKAAAE